MSRRDHAHAAARAAFFGVAHLVLGGLAVRLDLTFEQLEDLQVALGALLDQRDDGARRSRVASRVEGETIRARASGRSTEALRRARARRDGDELGLRRVLETVVDGVEVDERDGEPWVELTKAVASRADAGSNDKSCCAATTSTATSRRASS